MHNEENSRLFCRSQMAPDEYVLWSGRPEKNGIFMSGAEAFALLFSVVWTVLACYMIRTFLIDFRFGIASILPLIFPVVGIGLIVSQIRKALILRNHTDYVITNKRIYRLMGKRMDNFSASVTVGYETKYHRNGNATISFPMAIDPTKGKTRVAGQTLPRCFTINNIAEVDRVQQALSRMEF